MAHRPMNGVETQREKYIWKFDGGEEKKGKHLVRSTGGGSRKKMAKNSRLWGHQVWEDQKSSDFSCDARKPSEVLGGGEGVSGKTEEKTLVGGEKPNPGVGGVIFFWLGGANLPQKEKKGLQNMASSEEGDEEHSWGENPQFKIGKKKIESIRSERLVRWRKKQMEKQTKGVQERGGKGKRGPALSDLCFKCAQHLKQGRGVNR